MGDASSTAEGNGPGSSSSSNADPKVKGTKEAEAAAAKAAAQFQASFGGAGTEGPKHLGEGLSTLVCNIGMGVLGGVAALVAAPVVGAREEGSIGFAKGLGAGLVGCVALPIIGIVTGVKGLVEGAVATPTTMQATAQGKEWDAKAQEWKYYSLAAEAADINDPATEAKFAERRAEKKRLRLIIEEQATGEAPVKPAEKPVRVVKDTSLYDTLGVSPQATAGELKKAYYKRALTCHPDKHPGDEAKKAEFQRVGAAYQLLSDPQARLRYDKRGMDEMGEHSMGGPDAATFFAMVFGSEAFESLVGELQLASMMKQSVEETDEEEDDAPDAEEIAFKQQKRVLNIATHLSESILKPHLAPPLDLDLDEKHDDEAETREKATELSSTPFGATLVLVIAGVYEATARRALSTYAEGAALSIRDSAHTFGTKFEVVRDAAKAVSRTRAAAIAEKARQDATSEATKITPGEQETAEELCDDSLNPGPVSEACYRIISDKHGWETLHFTYRTSAVEKWRNLPYIYAAVLFERSRNPEDGTFGDWRDTMTYGLPSSIELIKDAAQIITPTTLSAPGRVTRESAAANASKHRQAEMMGAVMEAAWRLSVVDVESTLKLACHKVLYDHGVDPATRKERAKALLKVANIFYAQAKASGHVETWQQVLARQMGGGGQPHAQPPPPTPPDEQ